MEKKENLPTVGLALGSGGPRGLAHIGVIKVLEENNIPIDFIAGCSIGAMVGGLYALTKDIDWVERVAMETDWRRIVSLLVEPAFLSGGLVGGEKVEKFILDKTNRKQFKDIKIPFTVIATDINTGKKIEIREGSLAKAIRASSSIPLVFKPYKWKDKLLVDGGLSDPVPEDVVREMGAEIVIAVNLDSYSFQNGNTAKIHRGKLGVYAIANSAISILRCHLAQYCLQDADIVITPKVGGTGWAKFVDGQGIIRKGETATRLALPEIKKRFERLKG